jgi:cohesin complex subunit SCC1
VILAHVSCRCVRRPFSEHCFAATPLTPPPATPPPDGALASFPTPTPRTASRIAKLADTRDSTAKKKKTAKKQIVDSVTELEEGPGARGKRGLGQWKDPDVSKITTEQRFLPRSRVVMRLLEIQADPLAHFMPTTATSDGAFFCAAPPGLAPELTAMFMFPVRDLRRGRLIDGTDTNPRLPKKPRLENNENDASVQLGRRGGSDAPFDVSHDLGLAGTAGLDNPADFGLGDYNGVGADFTFDGAGEPMDLDMPDIQLDLDKAVRQQRHRSVSRLVDDTRSTPGVADDMGMEAYDSQSCTIGLFDIRSSRDSKGETQTQTQEAEDIERSTEQVQSKGYSKNTVKAIAVIRKGLEAEPEDDKYLSFNKVSDKASRRAASAFFFELLVLSTRDCVKITQSAPFENIEIRPKEKLYESLSANAPPVAA